jgi:dipeptidyl aminopeptidase/acylaminoacyl peptidase
VLTVADGRSVRLGGSEPASAPEWSPDGRLIAFKGTADGKKGLVVSRPDGSGLRFLAETAGTNSPLTFEGRGIAWSPDAKRAPRAVMVRYPREGHGLAEPKHAVDLMDRSVAWYEKHFARAGAP